MVALTSPAREDGGQLETPRGVQGTPRSGPGSTSGKPGKPGGTDGGTGSSGCCAARRASAHGTFLRAGVAEPDASEPGRRLRPPSTNARTRRAQAKWPYVVAVAEVVRRRRVSNTLAERPPKRGTPRVNGDLARDGLRQSAPQGVSLSEDGSGERTNEIRTAPWNQGAGSVKSQGDVRASRGGLRGPKGTAQVVGPGRAPRERTRPPDPGKGSLTMEGTSGRHAPRSFTRARARRPRLLSRFFRPTRPVRTRAVLRSHERRLGAFGGDEGSDRGVRGTVSWSASGRTGPWS